MAYEYYKLDNGVQVVLVPMPGVQSTAIGVYIQTGSRFETTKINGISHFLEHMVFKGTKNYPTTRDTSSLEGLGAIQNAWTDVDATSYWCKIPSDNWEKGLDLVKDLALYPTIPEKELEIERGVILEEINRYEDRPDERVGDVLMELMYKPNPLGMRILGEASVIKALTQADFLDYHKSHYQPEKMVVVLAGKLDSQMTKTKIEEHFAALPKGPSPEFEAYTEQQNEAKVMVYPKDTAEQVHIELAVRALKSTDPRRYALNILNSILGAGLSSRLFIEVREKKGLCYSISSDSARFRDTGLWSVHAGLNISRLEEALATILAEMRRIKDELVPATELEEAKRKLRGHLIFAQENPINQMEYYAHQLLSKDEIIDYDILIDSLMGVTAEQVRQVAQDLFVESKLNLAVVGPAQDSDKLLKLLKI
ncbi:insulinase family protein [Candidatus Woesebacteria bacterium]|nr:insulinase family protein [Candidatus Woesebacteria bacterium]